MSYRIVFTKNAVKDYEIIKRQPISKQVKKLLEIIENNPYQPPTEKLTGALKNAFSKRINIQHRLVYEVYEDEKMIKILSMWTHYGD